eukprot:TRINITY_DN8520_c0_g1_i6.p1 TRINITY_DN8520_c0_g1~~TRINITY_DN8520_c0_g1_i6.p1  ORF type:complete len:195 (-),score=58.28 TRINITY_DN8520_c0_g1_i6:252-836(-)
MDCLLEELFLKIVICLDCKDGLRFSLTKRRYYNLLQNCDYFWETKFIKNYLFHVRRDQNISYKEHIYVLEGLNFLKSKSNPFLPLDVPLLDVLLKEANLNLQNLTPPLLTEAKTLLDQQTHLLEHSSQTPTTSNYLKTKLSSYLTVKETSQDPIDMHLYFLSKYGRFPRNPFAPLPPSHLQSQQETSPKQKEAF